jgi:hypothetical protein
MTFAEMLAEVYILTNRPDLVEESKLAIRAATLRAHGCDFFPKDLYETGITWSTPAYIQSLEYRTLIPRWRAFKYLRKYDATSELPMGFFDYIPPELVLDSYHIQRENVCYLAGESLEIRSDTQDSYMLLGCYIHPIIVEGSYSSWIALDNPYAIIFQAAAKVLNAIGFDEQAQRFEGETLKQYEILRMTNITGNGY